MAVNLLFSSLQFNDIFSTIKSRGPLINQLHLICGSYPGQVRDLDAVRMLVAATEANSEFLNTARHQDPIELITDLLGALQEEMECEEEDGRMEAGTGARFGRLYTVAIIQHKWCKLRHSNFEQEEHTVLQLHVVDIVTKTASPRPSTPILPSRRSRTPSVLTVRSKCSSGGSPKARLCYCCNI